VTNGYAFSLTSLADLTKSFAESRLKADVPKCKSGGDWPPENEVKIAREARLQSCAKTGDVVRVLLRLCQAMTEVTEN